MPNTRTLRRSIAAATFSAAPTPPAMAVSAPTIPETGFLRQRQVLVFVPISKSTLWRRIQARTFPAPVKLSERVTVWRAEDIRHWIAQQCPGTLMSAEADSTQKRCGPPPIDPAGTALLCRQHTRAVGRLGAMERPDDESPRLS